MNKFSNFIVEQKNTHMEHIEDMIFNDGVDGARMAITSLLNLRDMLAGTSKNKVNVTVKWDGAPAIFAGIDPADGKFFVAKKGIFNVNPKLYKSQQEINADLSGDLKTKFAEAFKHFSKLGIKSGVYQGDLMFTKRDLKIATINGEKYYTFQPNTIVYAVPVNSALGVKLRKASIGVVWHTTYEGNSIANMKASFGRGIVDKFNQVPAIWMDDATYRDVSGTATFTGEETAMVTSMLSNAGKIFRTINGDVLRAIRDDEELKLRIKTYNNTYVRAGEPFPEPEKHVKGLYNYIDNWYQSEIDKKKTEKSKKEWTDKRDIIVKKLFANVDDLTQVFRLMNLIVQTKQTIIEKMNKASQLGTFLRTSTGLRVTNQEGYVAIDHIGNAVKVVDRLEFSKANFSPDVIKGWQR